MYALLLGIIVFTCGEVNWNALSALAGVFAGAVIIGRWFSKAYRNYRTRRENDEAHEDQVAVTIWGREAHFPYPAINGLVQDVAELKTTVAQMQAGQAEVRMELAKLVQRTEENGGSSMKDQLNMVVDYIQQRQREEADENS